MHDLNINVDKMKVLLAFSILLLWEASYSEAPQYLTVQDGKSIQCDTIVPIDFTNGFTSTWGQNAQDSLGGIFMMIAGNANGDGQINAVDRNNYWRPQNGQPFMYSIFFSDFNLDGAVNSVDINLYWRPNNSKAEQIPD